MASVFDDSALDDRASMAAADEVLRRLAGAGARLRQESGESRLPLSGLDDNPRPRAVITIGSEARLVRALLEPYCPVPFVAWPWAGLPGWVGALDLVVVLAAEGSSQSLISTVREAVRRGSQLIVACPPASPIAEHAAARETVLLPTETGDPLAAVIVALAGLCRMGLGPEISTEAIADAMDKVAEDCSPFLDVTENPAKDLALRLADAQPLVWGGTVLASRASRRIAEALRAASGRSALAADAEAMLPLLDAAAPRDPFADPFEEVGDRDRRPCVVIVDDGLGDEVSRVQGGRLRSAAERNDVRICVVSHQGGSDLERYATLLQTGLYAAVYLAVGLGRYRDEDTSGGRR